MEPLGDVEPVSLREIVPVGETDTDAENVIEPLLVGQEDAVLQPEGDVEGEEEAEEHTVTEPLKEGHALALCDSVPVEETEGQAVNVKLTLTEGVADADRQSVVELELEGEVEGLRVEVPLVD